MAEEFGILIKLEPKIDEGERKVIASLDAMEKQGKETGDAISAAIRDGFRDAATEVARAVTAEQRAMAQAESAAKAAEKAARDAAKAEREFQSAADDVFASLNKQTQAVGDTTTKTKEHNTTFAETVRQWIRGKGAAYEAIDAIGKLGLAMGTINQAVQVGTAAWNAFGSAVEGANRIFGQSSTPQQWQDFIASGGLRGASQFTRDFATSQAGQTEWWQDLEFAKSSNFQGFGMSAIDAQFNAAIAALEANVDRYKSAVEKARADISAEEKRLLGQSDALREHGLKYQAGGHTMTYDEYLAEKRDAARMRGGGGGPRRDMSGWDPQKLAASLDRYQAILDTWLTSADGLLFQIAQQRNGLLSAEAGGLSFTPDAIGDTSASDALAAGAGRRYFHNTGMSFSEKLAAGQGFKEAKKDAIDFAAALSGPVSSSIDGLIDGLVHWKMAWGDWGREALAMIEKVMIQLLALEAIEAIAGAGGGSTKIGRLLWGAFGGSPTGGSSKRVVPGDPFGGASGGSSGAVWREPVMPSQAPGGGYGAPVINLKVVNVSDAREAAREVINGPDGERAVVNHVDKNRGKLGR